MNFSKSTSVIFCSFPWKFNPMCFPFFFHFPALELFIHPSSALPLSKYSRPIPMAVMCCQYFNNVTITQLPPAPGLLSSGNHSVQELGSFCLSQGKKLTVLYYIATANLSLVEARQGWRKVVSITSMVAILI